MAEGLILNGFGPSVYTRIVRMALIEMGLDADYVECDPFSEVPDQTLAALTPFGRVPVLQQGDFTLPETTAILRYLDALATGPSLVPQDPRAAARMTQVMGIVDSYAYLPLVRDVFSHGFFRPLIGAAADAQRVEAGCTAAHPVLQALESIAAEGLVLNGGLTLADLHLAPMMDYFNRVPEAARMLADHPSLSAWWDGIKGRTSLAQTDPFAPT